jgi:hypothetical protein
MAGFATGRLSNQLEVVVSARPPATGAITAGVGPFNCLHPLEFLE